MEKYNLTAKKVSENKINIEFYTLPEPTCPKPTEKQLKSVFYCSNKEAWLNYEASKVSYPLKDECKEEFISELYGCIPFGENVLINLEKGISIDSIKERMELIKPDWESETRFEPFFVLLPIQVEEKETQE